MMKLLNFKTAFRRFLNRKLLMHRPPSYPYISGDGFRSIAKFVYDQFLDFEPTQVEYGDIIFVRNNTLLDFFIKIHPKIKNSYVLISHNEDSSIDKSLLKFIDNKILHWYAQNLTFKNSKLTLLPIGIQNFQTGTDNNFIVYKKQLVPEAKLTKILYGFTIGKNIEREKLLKILEKNNLADYVSLPRNEYYKRLLRYKFIVSPSGAGIDCHRTWEAMYLKVIPIMLRTSFGEQIAESGFPVLLIESWDDINKLDENYLTNYYESNKHSFNTPKLYLPYWYDTLSKYQDTIR